MLYMAGRDLALGAEERVVIRGVEWVVGEAVTSPGRQNSFSAMTMIPARMVMIAARTNSSRSATFNRFCMECFPAVPDASGMVEAIPSIYSPP